MIQSIQVLEGIANDRYNWSKEVREACKDGAEALRQREKLDDLLKCWEEYDGEQCAERYKGIH